MYAKTALCTPTRLLPAALWILLSTPILTAQEPAETVPLPPVPGEVQLGAPVQGQVAETPRDGVFHGAPATVPVPALDDGVPRPEPAVVRAGDDGDVVVERAGGDPEFLGFAAGPYYPPAQERLDPALLETVIAYTPDGRPGAEVFGFVMFAKRMTVARFEQLQALGVRVLRYHPYYTVAAALPVEHLHDVASLSFVRWIGVSRTWQKVHPALSEQLQSAGGDELLDVWVSVFDSDLCEASTSLPLGAIYEGSGTASVINEDPQMLVREWMSHGWQQLELQERGVEIRSYEDRILSFRARVRPSDLPRVLELDFVQFVEADIPDVPHHDESTPLVHSDATRGTYSGGTNQRAISGLIDSGLEVSHNALNHFAWVVWDFVGTGGTNDECGHGSHVAGTIIAKPPASSAGYTGNAPGLGWGASGRFRSAKRFGWNGATCPGAGQTIGTLLSTMRNSYTDGNGVVSPRPHVINNSWGADPSGSTWIGTEANMRAVDAEVWDHRQLYVFSAGNAGPGAGTIGSPAAAKNAFAVGAAVDYDWSGNDPGTIYSGSSRGPCGDGRWKPNVTAPGRWIRSVDSATTTDYTDKWGTSMAAPHVTGVAAQLVDHYSWMAYAPHSLASLLMATSTPKNNQPTWLDTDSQLDVYGAGRINAYRAHNTDVDWSWGVWSWNMGGIIWNGNQADFTVPSGTSRLIVCMTYHEPEASSGASMARLNDLDLYIDKPPLSAGTNTGDYVAHHSSINNTELRYIDLPAPGTWRFKVHPRVGIPFSAARVSVTVLVIHSNAWPGMNMSINSSDVYLQPGEQVDVSATLGPTDYMASAVFLDTTLSAGSALHESSTLLKDGVTTDLMSNQQSGRDVLLGDINDHSPRTATWTVSWPTDGVKSFTVNARSDNTTNSSGTLNLTVDGTPPPAVTNLDSLTHTIGGWSNDRTLIFSWSQAPDSLSGVDGYGEFWSSVNPTGVGAIKDFETSRFNLRTVNVTSDYSTLYYGLRAVDHSGNWSGETTVGPFGIDTVSPSAVPSVTSPTHTPGVWSNDPNVTVVWTPATDDRSGVAQYATKWLVAGVIVPCEPNIAPGVLMETRTFQNTPTNGMMFGVRAVDAAGNCGPQLPYGVFLVDTEPPTGVSLDIDSGADGTTTTSVNLAIGATDTRSGLGEMRFRNDGGTWSPWQRYAATTTWNIRFNGGSTRMGTRTVEVEVRDEAGNVTGASDTIYFHHRIIYFGTPCNGSQGTPVFSISGLPGLGKNMTFQVGHTAATLGSLYLGLSNTSWQGIPLPLDLGIIGSAGCELSVSPTFTFYKGAPGAVPVTIPVDPSVVDVPLYFQWHLFFDPSGQFIVTTRGAEVKLSDA